LGTVFEAEGKCSLGDKDDRVQRADT
jgi:hypothetical protein